MTASQMPKKIINNGSGKKLYEVSISLAIGLTPKILSKPNHKKTTPSATRKTGMPHWCILSLKILSISLNLTEFIAKQADETIIASPIEVIQGFLNNAGYRQECHVDS